MNKLTRAACLVLSCLVASLLLMIAPKGARATELPDASRSGSLSLEVSCGDVAVSGVNFRAWRVAGFDARGQFELASGFAGSGVELASLEKASEWDAAASELLAWAENHGVAEDATGQTDLTGRASFTGLVPGLYLLAGSSVTQSGYTYVPATYLESVPQVVDGELVYDVTSACKVGRTDAPMTPTTPSAPGDSDPNEGAAEKSNGQTWAQRMGLVQTGDNSLTLRGLLVLVVAGAVLVAMGIVLWPRRRKDADGTGR